MKSKKNARKYPTSSEKEAFLREIASIKPYLPRNYGVLVNHINTSISKRKIYNTIHNGVVDWEILRILKTFVCIKK